MLDNLIPLLINLVEGIKVHGVWRIPEILIFLKDFICDFTLLGRNNTQIPLDITCQGILGHIGTTKDNAIDFILSEDISLGVESIIRRLHIVHTKSDILETIQLFEGFGLTKIEIICCKNLSWNLSLLKFLQGLK